jgi:UDP-2-acetamido-3-amino-2,3-dideoxy-glucuronate N-acetyltransferase
VRAFAGHGAPRAVKGLDENGVPLSLGDGDPLKGECGRVAIGAVSKVWHVSHILGDVTIGEKCNIGQNVVIGPRGSVRHKRTMQNDVSVPEAWFSRIARFAAGPAYFANLDDPCSKIVRQSEHRRTFVRRGAEIGARATIVCCHEQASCSFIGAGPVVAKDAPACAQIAGVPVWGSGGISHVEVKLGAGLVRPETRN